MTRPQVLILPADTPLYQVKITCKQENMRPTIDAKHMRWVLRPMPVLVR